MHHYQHSKNLLHHKFILKIQQILGSHELQDMATPKISSQLLICINLYQHAKNQLIPSAHWDTVNFRVQRTDWPHPFLFMPKHKISNQHLLFVNFYQHAKNEAVIDFFWKNSWCKNPTSDWLRAFWPVSLEEHFSWHRIFAGTLQIT